MPATLAGHLAVALDLPTLALVTKKVIQCL